MVACPSLFPASSNITPLLYVVVLSQVEKITVAELEAIIAEAQELRTRLPLSPKEQKTWRIPPASCHGRLTATCPLDGRPGSQSVEELTPRGFPPSLCVAGLMAGLAGGASQEPAGAEHTVDGPLQALPPPQRLGPAQERGAGEAAAAHRRRKEGTSEPGLGCRCS